MGEKRIKEKRTGSTGCSEPVLPVLSDSESGGT